MRQQCQFCSTVSKANGEDPIGSAGNYDCFLLIETLPPWSGAIWLETGAMPQGVINALALAWERGVNLRPLAIAPEREYAQPGFTRVLYFYRQSPLFAAFNRQEYLIPDATLSQLVMALLNEPEQLPLFQPYKQNSSIVRDLLICTHGNYDVACSRFGYPIYNLLRQSYATTFEGHLRIWRCSHFGGHQFAPTLLDLPSGRYWGHLEADVLDILVNHADSIKALRPFYRGWAGLKKFEQIAEREIWMQEGWDWINYLKTGKTLAIDLSDEDYPNWAEVRIDFTSVNGHSGAYEARIEAKGTVKTMWTSGKDQPLWEVKQYHVSRLDKVVKSQIMS